MSMSDCRTKSRLILHIGVRVDEVVRLISGKDAGLDEAQQGVELLQVVLDGSPRQQDSEADWELHETRRHEGKLKKNYDKREVNIWQHKREAALYLSQGFVQKWVLILQPVSFVDHKDGPLPPEERSKHENREVMYEITAQ